MWRSPVMSGSTARVAVSFSVASEAPFDGGHAAMAGALCAVCFGIAYPASRLVHARAARPPMPSYPGETPLALPILACGLLVWRDPSLARPAYPAPCVSPMPGGFADAFRLSAAAMRRGVGLRQASVPAARFERRGPAAVDR